MRKSLFLCFLLLTFISCANYEDISVVDVRVDNISFQSTSQIMLTLGVKVDNPTRKTLKISDGVVDVFRGEQNLATMSVSEPATVAPKSNDYNRLTLQVQVKDLMALAGLNAHDSAVLDQFDVEGFLKVKSGIASRKLKIDRTNFKSLLQSLK